ncbi:hypothetical protein ANO14919_009980 [Xylariales sp. No.14919]|nr:hypothetical protein ANO14919_009980 [Xylariales sp. No.14919]
MQDSSLPVAIGDYGSRYKDLYASDISNGRSAEEDL